MPPPTDAKEALKDQDFGYRASDALNAELSKRKILGTTYSDFNTALGAWADTAQPFQERFGTELSSNIYAVPGGWQIGPSYSNGSRCSGGEMCTTSPMPGSVPSGLYWGYIHTHPTNFGGLDYADTNYGRGYTDGKPDDYAGGSYVSLPNGQINGWMRGMSPPDRSNPGTGQFMIRPPQNRPRGFR